VARSLSRLCEVERRLRARLLAGSLGVQRLEQLRALVGARASERRDGGLQLLRARGHQKWLDR